MGGLVDLITGNGGKKAARIQAAATLKTAADQAAADREAARGSVLTQQTLIAQKNATDRAGELLDDPQEAATVVLSREQDAPEIDPETGRRKTRRGQFFRPAGQSGITI